jgi:hypothetical protein
MSNVSSSTLGKLGDFSSPQVDSARSFVTTFELLTLVHWFGAKAWAPFVFVGLGGVPLGGVLADLVSGKGEEIG